MSAETGGQWVYGIAHRSDEISTGDVHRENMTLLDAEEWLADWHQDGGNVSAFRVIRRWVGDWQEVPDEC